MRGAGTITHLSVNEPYVLIQAVLIRVGMVHSQGYLLIKKTDGLFNQRNSGW